MILDWLAKLAPREKVGLGVALVCLLIMVLYNLVVETVLTGLDDVGRDLRKAAKTLEYYDRALLRTNGVNEAYSRVTSALAAPADRSEAMDRLNVSVEEIAQRTGLEVSATMPRETQEVLDKNTGDHIADRYQAGIENFQASADSLLKFLHEIWISADMLRVTKLSITSVKDSNAVKGSMLITKVALPAQAQEE